MLHALEVPYQLAELLSLEQVGSSGIQTAFREANHLRTDADATLVQYLDSVPVALSYLSSS